MLVRAISYILTVILFIVSIVVYFVTGFCYLMVNKVVYVSFQDFQLTSSQPTNVTDRQTDRQTDDMHSCSLIYITDKCRSYLTNIARLLNVAASVDC